MAERIYFSHQDPISAQSFINYEINKASYHRWWFLLEDADEHDADSLITELMAATGCSRYEVNQAIRAVALVRMLPGLRRLVEEMFHVNISYLARIMDAVAPAAMAILDPLEKRIISRLTPRVAGEMMIQAGHLAGLITRWIKELDPSHCGPQPRSEREGEYLEFQSRGDHTYIRARLATADARRFKDSLEAVGGTRIPLAQALREFLDAKAPVQVVQYLYTPRTGGRSWMAGVGYLGPLLARDWKKRVAKEVELDAMDSAVEKGYRPSQRMRAAVIARDAHCRFPGCSVPADRCQLDHVRPWAAGGPTAMWNLMCLCQHHHNMKSDGRFTPELDELGEVLWIGPMNRPVVVRPEGPFAEEMPTGLWGQKLRVRLKEWRRKRREEAHRTDSA
ncbi:HNH endonuclease signature motif containing protein [Corynebacterium pacaense]|uniref:HNH endonuclease signature motif containing protein n=1 Tax=Corynebacterium pacaense TaxID=1816684 RepID=UPI0009BB2317|nr:HNH endonuclease signature motif containing protein [Corynebacterium pacaense]